MQTAIPAVLMRGGTSKGLYFLSKDLPRDEALRNRILSRVMGSPDTRQIDGVGGAHPLSSKVAIVGKSEREEVDVDYLFLQVVVDSGEVKDSQNCGNILAGVGYFALEQGLLPMSDEYTDVRIHMENSGSVAVARIPTPNGHVEYGGSSRIDGVPGTAAPVSLAFEGIAGANCGALFPTGNVRDKVDGIDVTAIDNGMPVVLIAARDLGKTGYETPAELEADSTLKDRVEQIRLALGESMNLGNVTDKTVPKMSLVSPPQKGGNLSTRTFIPHRVHNAIGVLGAVSVASACLIEGTVAEALAQVPDASGPQSLEIEHPTGSFTVELESQGGGHTTHFTRAALLRTARKLMDGQVYIPADLWSRT